MWFDREGNESGPDAQSSPAMHPTKGLATLEKPPLPVGKPGYCNIERTFFGHFGSLRGRKLTGLDGFETSGGTAERFGEVARDASSPNRNSAYLLLFSDPLGG